MTDIKLDEDQRKLLEWLGAPEQIDYDVLIAIIPGDVLDSIWGKREINSLKRRKLVEQSGRGRLAQISITDAGLEAIGQQPREQNPNSNVQPKAPEPS